uniref:Uncharacterized protein n=1 Tax=Pyxicephalus adspersus TaxID=30357 RepID=A0AAV3AYY9_PYXAD|nr:TPA: hypothetical protein GDO54_000825 [Pyxicephalus adspersus]
MYRDIHLFARRGCLGQVERYSLKKNGAIYNSVHKIQCSFFPSQRNCLLRTKYLRIHNIFFCRITVLLVQLCLHLIIKTLKS